MHDALGREIPDQTPLERALSFQRPPSLQDTIKRLVQQELSAQAAAQGYETFEEADDFDVGDDYDPRSPHELDQEQEVALTPARLAELEAAEEKLLAMEAAKERKRQKAKEQKDVSPDGEAQTPPASGVSSRKASPPVESGTPSAPAEG